MMPVGADVSRCGLSTRVCPLLSAACETLHMVLCGGGCHERGQPGDACPWNQMPASSPASAKSLDAESACSRCARPAGWRSLCSDITMIVYFGHASTPL